jgi:hypothetical protein
MAPEARKERAEMSEERKPNLGPRRAQEILRELVMLAGLMALMS